jgi:hypothetical protein
MTLDQVRNVAVLVRKYNWIKSSMLRVKSAMRLDQVRNVAVLARNDIGSSPQIQLDQVRNVASSSMRERLDKGRISFF